MKLSTTISLVADGTELEDFKKSLHETIDALAALRDALDHLSNTCKEPLFKAISSHICSALIEETRQ